MTCILFSDVGWGGGAVPQKPEQNWNSPHVFHILNCLDYFSLEMGMWYIKRVSILGREVRPGGEDRSKLFRIIRHEWLRSYEGWNNGAASIIDVAGEVAGRVICLDILGKWMWGPSSVGGTWGLHEACRSRCLWSVECSCQDHVVSDSPPSQAATILRSSAVPSWKRIALAGLVDYLHPLMREWRMSQPLT